MPEIRDVEGTDVATGIPYVYRGPVVIDNMYVTKFHTPEPPLIVTLCGSVRFKQDFLYANHDFSKLGWVVLTIGWGDPDPKVMKRPEDDMKIMLDELHKQKIDMSMCIYVVGDGYVGDSTHAEIMHANQRGIRVFMQTEASPEEVTIAMKGMHDG